MNVQGVFDYCYHLFEEQNDLLFGHLPQGSFEFKACKDHRDKTKKGMTFQPNSRPEEVRQAVFRCR